MPRTATPTSDPYRRRREAGAASREETRRRLLTAAGELFREQGYPATTVAAIAARADVSLQTLYLAWGGKGALLIAATAAAAVDTDLPVTHDQWRATVLADLARSTAGRPTAGPYLAAVARLWVRVADRAAPWWHMTEQAATGDPEIATEWAAITAERRRTMDQVAAAVPRSGLRAGIEDAHLADTLWALASPDLHALFTTQGGRPAADYEAWLTRTLVTALCAPEEGPRP